MCQKVREDAFMLTRLHQMPQEYSQGHRATYYYWSREDNEDSFLAANTSLCQQVVAIVCFSLHNYYLFDLTAIEVAVCLCCGLV